MRHDSAGILWGRLSQWLRGRLWVIPSVAAAVALLAARGLVALDRNRGGASQGWFLYGGEPESARALLTTIATSMMTFIGLVFSITILVLQLASGQFSPRVLRTFLGDRDTRRSMATFVATFVYAMALLSEVRIASDGGVGFVPALAVFVAFLLVLASVGVFIQYIDHMANSVRAITIIKRISRETSESIDRIFPERVTDGPPPSSPPRPGGPPTAEVRHEGPGGVLTHVDPKALIAAAKGDAVIAVVPMPGDFVARGSPLLRVWGGTAEARRLRNAVGIQKERTQLQDPAFGFRQLVDIAERALSPGVNDPSTAVQVIDEVHDLLRQLADRRLAPAEHLDAQGALRVILPRPDWEDFVRMGFDEIRQYGDGSLQIQRRMRAVIASCLEVVPPERRPILEEQLRLLDRAAEREFGEGDRQVARTPSDQGHGPA